MQLYAFISLAIPAFRWTLVPKSATSLSSYGQTRQTDDAML